MQRPLRGVRPTIPILAVLAVLAMVMGLMVPVTAQVEADRYVAADGVDDSECIDPEAPCATIDYAISVSDEGDVISVGPGEYDGATVGQSVTLLGPNAGVDPRQGHADGATISGTLSVQANDVTIDGFTITGDGAYGVQIGETSGTTVTNSIIEGSTVGVGTSPSGTTLATSGIVVARNVIRGNSINGVTLHSLQGSDYEISDNEFSDNAANGITVNANRGSLENVLVSGNTSSGSETFVAVIGHEHGIQQVEVTDNDVTGTSQSAIFLGGSVDAAALTSNVVADSATAVSISDLFGSANTGVSVENNTFQGNFTAVSITSSGDPHEVRLDGNTYEGNETDLLRDPEDHPIDIDAPESTTPPSIGGEAVVGAILTAEVGVWESEFGLDFGLQWLLDGEPVDGATGDTFPLSAEHVGSTVRLEVTATDILGQTTVETSAPTLEVTEESDPPVDIPPAPSEDELTEETRDPDASVTNLSGGSIQPGDMIRVELSGFQPFEWVFLRLYSQPIDLGWFQADGNGDLVADIRVPARILSGTHSIVATGAQGSLVWTEFEVSALDPLDFEDVPDDHLFRRDIDWLSANRITRGCNPPANDRFCPDADISRGQMAAFLNRALGLPAGESDFVDAEGHLFERDIAALAAADITRGCNPPANDRFCPDDPITRGEMAAFLHRALSG